MLRSLVGSDGDQAKRTKQLGEIGLRSGRPHDGFHIDALCQTGTRHRFPIVGPIPDKDVFCAFAVVRPESSTVRQMTKQHGLKAWVLPNERNVVIGCHTARPFSPQGIESELVSVEQKKAGVGGDAFFSLLPDAPYSCFNARKRVASTPA